MSSLNQTTIYQKQAWKQYLGIYLYIEPLKALTYKEVPMYVLFYIIYHTLVHFKGKNGAVILKISSWVVATYVSGIKVPPSRFRSYIPFSPIWHFIYTTTHEFNLKV